MDRDEGRDGDEEIGRQSGRDGDQVGRRQGRDGDQVRTTTTHERIASARRGTRMSWEWDGMGWAGYDMVGRIAVV